MNKSLLRGLVLVATLVAFALMLDAQRHHSSAQMEELARSVQ